MQRVFLDSGALLPSVSSFSFGVVVEEILVFVRVLVRNERILLSI